MWKRLNGTGNFPIFGDIDGPNNWNTHKPTRLQGIDIGAHEVIDRLQPCHKRKDAPLHPLAVLNKLSNIDKHQAIHLTKPHSTDTTFTFRSNKPGEPAIVIQPPVVFHDHREVTITGVPKNAVHSGMDVNIKGTLFVALKDTEGWPRANR